MSKFIDKVLALLPLPKVETILKSVTSLVTRLEAAVEAHARAVIRHEQTAAVALAKKVESELQIDKAKTVVANVKALLGN